MPPPSGRAGWDGRAHPLPSAGVKSFGARGRPRRDRRRRARREPAPVRRYFSLREWGKAQDPPMSVQEVVDSKVASLNKVVVTKEEVIDAITPF